MSVRRLDDADRDRFARAILPHLDAAWRLARWLVRDRATAEDVAQEAMLRALTYFTGFRDGDARAWLLRIVRNTAHDWRTARPPTEDLPEEIVDPAETPEERLRRWQDGAALERALAVLPPDLRECLVLRELEELSYKEIASVTGTPIGTVMSRLHRARRALIEGGAP